MPPTYDYRCQSPECTQEEFSRDRKITEDTATCMCPTCTKKAVQIPSTGTSFSLKGGGWYADGYSRGG